MYYICYYVVSYLSTNKTISFDDELFVILQKRAKKNRRPFATYINELLWRVVKDEQSNTASISPTLVVESLRNALTRSKKSSPMKTELVTILNSILKEGEPTLETTIVDLGMKDDPELDTWLKQREEKQKAKEKEELAGKDAFRPGGALERALERGGKKDKSDVQKIIKKSVPQKHIEPEEDWHPDE